MAMTVAVPTLDGPEGAIRRVIGTLTAEASYTSGGMQVPLSTLGGRQLVALSVFNPPTGYVFEWDGSVTAPKVKAWYQKNVTGALSSVPAGTDLSASVAPFIAYVRT